MKDYNEVAREVLARRDEYVKSQKKKRVRTGRILVIAAAVTLIAAFAVVTLPLFHRIEEPLTEPFQPEDTTDADVMENPKPTYSSMREFAEKIERYAAGEEEVLSESGFQIAPGNLRDLRDLRLSLRTLDAPTLTLRESGVTWSAATGYETIYSASSDPDSGQFVTFRPFDTAEKLDEEWRLMGGPETSRFTNADGAECVYCNIPANSCAMLFVFDADAPFLCKITDDSVTEEDMKQFRSVPYEGGKTDAFRYDALDDPDVTEDFYGLQIVSSLKKMLDPESDAVYAVRIVNDRIVSRDDFEYEGRKFDPDEKLRLKELISALEMLTNENITALGDLETAFREAYGSELADKYFENGVLLRENAKTDLKDAEARLNDFFDFRTRFTEAYNEYQKEHCFDYFTDRLTLRHSCTDDTVWMLLTAEELTGFAEDFGSYAGSNAAEYRITLATAEDAENHLLRQQDAPAAAEEEIPSADVVYPRE